MNCVSLLIAAIYSGKHSFGDFSLNQAIFKSTMIRHNLIRLTAVMLDRGKKSLIACCQQMMEDEYFVIYTTHTQILAVI